MLNKGILDESVAAIVNQTLAGNYPAAAEIPFDNIGKAITDTLTDLQLNYEELCSSFNSGTGEKYNTVFKELVAGSVNQFGLLYTINLLKTAKPWRLASDEDYEQYLFNIAREIDSINAGTFDFIFKRPGKQTNKVKSFIDTTQSKEPLPPVTDQFH